MGAVTLGNSREESVPLPFSSSERLPELGVRSPPPSSKTAVEHLQISLFVLLASYLFL